MMARKDINVHIKARDDASKNAKKAADALARLAADGKKAADTASATGRAFAEMQVGLGKLDTGALRDFSKIVGEMDKARGAVDRLGKQLDSNTKSFNQARAASSDAARTSEQLRYQIERENAAQATRGRALDSTTAKEKANAQALKEAQRAQEALNGARRKGITASGNQASSGIGIESGAPRSSARDSFSVFLGADIAAAEAAKGKLADAIAGLTTSIAGGKARLKGYSDELRQASATERELANEAERAGNAILKSRADLVKAENALKGFEGQAESASSSLGGLAANQEAVANASRKASAELAAMQARLSALSSKNALGVVGKSSDEGGRRAQIENLRTLSKAYDAAQIEAQRLGRAMAQAEAPTDELGESFGRARAQAAQLKQALNEQRAALRTRGSFGALGASDTSGAAAGADAQALGQIAPAAQRATTAKNQLAQASGRAAGAMTLFGNNTRASLSFLQRMRGELLAVTASFVGFYAAFERGRAAVQSFQAIETATARLGVAFSGDMGKVNREIEWLNAQADRLGFTFETLAGGYGKISVAASSAGFSIAETRELFESLSVAARVNNTSLTEMQGVLRAVEQMLSKGKVQAEELRGQLGDRMTAAFQTFATALGMTTQELDEALKKGEVYANRETMLKFAARLDQMYGSRLPKSMQTLSYALGQFQRDAEKANLAIARGLVPGLQDALKAFNEFVNSSEGQQLFTDIGQAAGALVSVLAQVPQYFGMIATAAKAFVAVKVAQWLTSMAAGFDRGASGFNTYARGLQLAARNGQQLTLMQRTLSLGLLNTTRAMSVYEARLRSSVSATATARVGTLAFAGSLGILRGAMMGIAAVARTMWAAIGGPVGVAIAGVGLVMATWKSDADKATSALREHERQLAAVKAAYDDVTDKSADWLKNVRGLTAAQATASVDAMRESYEAATKELEAYSRQATAWYADIIQAVPDDPRAIQAVALNDLAKQFREGALSVDEFIERLNDIANTAADEEIKGLALGMLDMLNTVDENGDSIENMGKALAKAEANLRVMNRTADEGDKELLGLKSAVDETNAALDKTSFVQTYTDAIKELREQIPSLADELKHLKDITELNASAWKGLTAAWNAGDYSKIFEIAALWGQGQADFAMDRQNKRLDAYGAGDSDVVNRIIYVEGGQGGNGPSTSSARGVGQFIESTWLNYLDRLYPELRDLNRTQKLALRAGEENREIQMKVMTTFTRDNQNQLLRGGVNAGATETYLAHFLGAGDAVKVLLANPEELAANIVNPASVRANPSVFKGGMTVGDLINWSARKMGDGSGFTSSGQTENEKTREEEAKATEQRLADLDHQVEQQKLINAGKEREAAIEDAIRQAKAENAAISETELQAIREKAGAQWDLANATREQEMAEQRINQLQTLRQQLMEQRDQAVNSGDSVQIAALDQQLVGVNARLQEAVTKAIAMWQAIGGPEADAKIASLQTLQGSIKAGQQQFGMFGLSMQTWRDTFDNVLNGVVGAFDAMAQAIANGENAFKAFGTAVLQTLAQVLQQIGATIIRMQILKMLQGMGGGIGGFATAALGMGGMTGHTGGLVGSLAIGTGNAIRPSGWVANAFSGPYHSGGLAGLRPDEVSATLKKNEEILTEEDPRHRFNAGGEKTRSDGTRLKQVLAIGDAEIANAMSGAAGEQVQLTMIRRNAPTIRRMLGV